MTAYLIPASEGHGEITEKRSRFIGFVAPISEEAEARDLIAEVRHRYHDARHHCWCYRLSDGTERFSDDGEPQGSAGMPMLEMFRHEEIADFVCVVTRYFGGVLLGTGGLSRAYTAAAGEALLDAGTRKVGMMANLRLRVSYPMLEKVRILAQSAGALLLEQDYGEDVGLVYRLPWEESEKLREQIFDRSGGKIQPEREGPFFC